MLGHFCAHFKFILPATLQQREDKTLAACNLEEESNPSLSNGKAAVQSLTARLHVGNTADTTWCKELGIPILSEGQISSFSSTETWRDTARTGYTR